MMVVAGLAVWGLLVFIQHRPPAAPAAQLADRSADAVKPDVHASSARTEQEPRRQAATDVMPGPARPSGDPTAEARAKQAALKARIMQAQERRTSGSSSAAPGPPGDDPDRPGTLKDRVGGREALVGQLNQHFMPLARECIQQALEESPELDGMLALSVEVVADPDLGAIIDVAKAAPENEIHHAGLLECIRESALSVTFPPSLVAGREVGMLTLRVVPKAETERR